MDGSSSGERQRDANVSPLLQHPPLRPPSSPRWDAPAALASLLRAAGGSRSPAPGAAGRTGVSVRVRPRQGAPLRAATGGSGFRGSLAAVPTAVPSEACVTGTGFPTSACCAVGSFCSRQGQRNPFFSSHLTSFSATIPQVCVTQRGVSLVLRLLVDGCGMLQTVSSCLLGTSDPPDTACLCQHAPAPQPACASVPSWRPGTGGVRASAAL